MQYTNVANTLSLLPPKEAFIAWLWRVRRQQKTALQEVAKHLARDQVHELKMKTTTVLLCVHSNLHAI